MMRESMGGYSPFDDTQKKVNPFEQTARVKASEKKNTESTETEKQIMENWFGRMGKTEKTEESFEGPIQVEGRDFRIIKKIGEGAMGDAYLAHEFKMRDEMDEGFSGPVEEVYGPDVVIKVMKSNLFDSEKEMEQFKKEIAEQSSVSEISPYIVPVIDQVDIHLKGGDKTVGMLLQYMEDGDLDGVAKEVHTEDSKEQSERTDAIISSVAVQLCKAVGAMHSKNLIHRDIKPKNIFLNKKAHTIKLGDFGVVYAIEHANPDERGITGTVDYMPPEGFSTDAVPNKGYDLYAIGGVLYNLRTGKAPIYVESEDDTYLKRMYNKATYDVPSIREQLGDKYEPSYLDDIIMTLLKRNPEDRTHVTIEGKEYLLESAVDISHAIEELAQKYNVPTDVL